MSALSGKCLCGNISFSADTDIKMAANCHCDDCRAATGSAYGTNLFVEAAAVTINGEPKVFSHTADSGATMEKLFCPNCGSLMFGRSSNRAGVMTIRAGVVDQKDRVQPTINVFVSSKIESTPLDPELTSFDAMPG